MAEARSFSTPECPWGIALESCTLGSRRNTMPDPDPARDQGPTRPEASQNSASDETELTDEQLEKAAGGSAGLRSPYHPDLVEE